MTIELSLPSNLIRKISSLAPSRNEQEELIVYAIRYYLDDIWYKGEDQKRKKALETIKRLQAKSGNWDGTAEVIKWREKR